MLAHHVPSGSRTARTWPWSRGTRRGPQSRPTDAVARSSRGTVPWAVCGCSGSHRMGMWPRAGPARPVCSWEPVDVLQRTP